MPTQRGTAGLGWTRALVALCLLIPAGCGDDLAPTAADEDTAKRTLVRVLTAWRQGETTATLKNASPAVVVADHQWDRGDRLTRYEIEGPGTPWGAERAYRVKLWLTNARGKTTRDVAEYKVGADPILTVARSVFH